MNIMLESNQIYKILQKEFPKLDVQTEQAQKLSRFMDVLEKWGKKMNLTALKTREEFFTRHLIDSLQIFTLQNFSEESRWASTRWVDLGSGAGLPAIPLAVFWPTVEITAVDAVGKKIAFQDYARVQLGLKKLKPLHTRHEDLVKGAEYQNQMDVVITRAYDQMEGLFSLSLQLLKPKGLVVMWKGKKWQEEIAAVSKETLEKFELIENQTYRLNSESGGRMLVYQLKE